MKKNLFILMFCCAAAQLMAFPIIEPNGFIWEYDYEYNDDQPDNICPLYARRHYTYDEQGRVTRYEQWEQWYSFVVDSIPSAIFEYTYGPYGMLTRVVNSYNESNHAYYQSSKWEYFYDENGLLSRFNSYKKTSLDTYHIYAYNDDNQLIRETQYNSFGQITINEAFTYDSLGHLVELSSTRLGHVYYTYDDAGNLIQEENWLGDGPASRSTYTYDADGRMITFFSQRNINGEGLVDICTGEYVYNEHGDLIREFGHSFVVEFMEDWDISYSYEYDAQGRMTRYENENGYYLYSYSETEPTAVENTSADKPLKVMQDGRVLIRRGNRWYDTMGRPAEKPY